MGADRIADMIAVTNIYLSVRHLPRRDFIDHAMAPTCLAACLGCAGATM
jgi:hypothetical protein